MKKFSVGVQNIQKLLPFMLMGVAIILYFKYGKNITAENIFNFTPENYITAIIIIIGMYALKPLFIVFPVAILYISSGMIFPFYLAVIINILGIAISLSIPFGIGHFSGKELANKLIKRYPKLRQFESMKENNENFFIFITRIIGIIPMDVVSIFMGSIGVSFENHLIYSILAMIPDLLIVTFIGATLDDPLSAEFILSCVLKVIIIVISIITYKRQKRSLTD